MVKRKSPNRKRSVSPRAFTVSELCCVIAALTLLLATVLPALAGVRKQSMLDASLGNLIDLGAAHALYAAEWDGRQVTVIVDDISTYADNSVQAFVTYNSQNDPDHPPLGLGWGLIQPSGEDLVYFAYRVGGNDANNGLVTPIRFGPPPYGRYWGSFRVPNASPFHEYVGGRFYDPTFYAPGDRPAWNTVVANGCLDSLDEFADCVDPVPGIGALPVWSSYCFSPAALFHPDVMRSPLDGGFQFPWDLDHGFEAPGFFQAQYPALKTLMLEHHWVQNAPKDVCNPNFDVSVYLGNCEPYYFNHAIDSAPAALFYDLSVRVLPNTEARAADQQVQKQTGAGLWSRDTPFGTFGYRSQYGFDDISVSHHILTTDGILGRDTTAGAQGS